MDTLGQVEQWWNAGADEILRWILHFYFIYVHAVNNVLHVHIITLKLRVHVRISALHYQNIFLHHFCMPNK